jgi:hypothetical protein
MAKIISRDSFKDSIPYEGAKCLFPIIKEK